MEGTKIKLSAMIIARNEENRLGACLDCLRFADEIVVVLDRSTDKSAEIAKAHGAKVVEGAWEIEGPRRQAGQDACTGDWILEIDADERVSDILTQEVKDVLAKIGETGSGHPDWFRIPFDNYIGDRLVRYGWGAYFGVSARATLYRKGVKSWGDQRVHPRVKMLGLCGGALQNPIAHYVDDDISDMIARLDRYTTGNAIDQRGTVKLGTYRKNVFRLFGRFWKCFVLRKGYREGSYGLIIAIFAALYPLLSYMKAQELDKAEREANKN